jgi:SAM-dependent methyltransferase
MTRSQDADSLSDEEQRRVESTQESYERIPYRTHAWTSSQPARLETVAALWGLEAAPADACRVLELGCGDGGNLIPLAIAHPDAHFVGVDLAPVHIEAGRALAEKLGVSNVALHAASFVDFEDAGGDFDYIIAHGLMSWVTPQLQELLFATCKRLMSRRGISFISYNTYPGWFMQHAIREMLRRHNQDVADIEDCLARSRDLLDVLIATVPERESAYKEYLTAIGDVARNPDRKYYFAHEYLEDENHPFYVRDFIERAAAHGLQYLADADQIDVELDNMPEAPSKLLEGLAEGRTQRLQVLDFAVNRKFRQTLLCHDDAVLGAEPDLRAFSDMHVASLLNVDAEAGAPAPDIAGDGVVCFSDRHGRTIEVDQPIVKAALVRFCEVSRQPIHFEALLAWARERIGSRPTEGSEQDLSERELLAMVLGRIHLADVLEAQKSPPCWALSPGERPLASPLARLCAEHGDDTASLRHRTVALDNEAVCAVLAKLDGSRSHADLHQLFEGQLEAEQIERILELAAENAILIR